MSVSYVRQLSDGEELILAERRGPTAFASYESDPREALHESADPREASFERRNRALSEPRQDEASMRAGSPSPLPGAVEP